VLANARETIRAIGASGEVASYLELKKGAPVLTVARVVTDLRRGCVEEVEAYHRSDRYDYCVTLGAT
jgi:DNA-binding GntR family transcriptional regulator